MLKWILGIIALLVLIVALALGWLVWLAMAYDLQRNLEDNLTLLKRDTILQDRDLSLTYQDGGVEMSGLQPAYTLIQPMLIYVKGVDEYRFTADEMTFHGSFFGNETVTLKAPETIQMTRRVDNGKPEVLKLKFEDALTLDLVSVGVENPLWHQYQNPTNQSGTVQILKDDKIEGRINYEFYKLPERPLDPPYSPHIDRAIKQIEAKVQ